MKNLTIFDLDGLIFIAGWQYRFQLSNIGKMGVKKKIDELIINILKRSKADYYIGFYGAEGSKVFRHDWATVKPYKGSRKSEEWQQFFKPVIKEHFKEKWGAHALTTLEADDAVVIAYHLYKDKYNITISTDDKDTKQVGEFKKYNPRNNKVEEISHIEGRKFFWSQMVHGDTVDAIGGIKGMGEKAPLVKIINALENPTEEQMYNLVRDGYIEVYGEDYLYHMVENYILLCMVNKPSFDYPKDAEPIPYKREETVKRLNLDL